MANGDEHKLAGLRVASPRKFEVFADGDEYLILEE